MVNIKLVFIPVVLSELFTTLLALSLQHNLLARPIVMSRHYLDLLILSPLLLTIISSGLSAEIGDFENEINTKPK
jgi:hypothetical protein